MTFNVTVKPEDLSHLTGLKLLGHCVIIDTFTREAVSRAAVLTDTQAG